jgi:hypothetical protein
MKSRSATRRSHVAINYYCALFGRRTGIECSCTCSFVLLKNTLVYPLPTITINSIPQSGRKFAQHVLNSLPTCGILCMKAVRNFDRSLPLKEVCRDTCTQRRVPPSIFRSDKGRIERKCKVDVDGECGGQISAAHHRRQSIELCANDRNVHGSGRQT